MVISGSTKLDSWFVDSWSIMRRLLLLWQIHFVHGTSCKARMEATPNRRGDSFLYGVVKNEVYMEQSQGFETHDRQSHVYKALYGLK